LLALEWPGNITSVPEIFTVFGGHCLYQCDSTSHYLPARTVDNTRKAAHRQLKIYTLIYGAQGAQSNAVPVN